MNYKEHYRIDAEEFDYWGEDQYSPAESRRMQAIYSLVKVRAGEKILDIGSGRGWFSLHAAAKGADVTALDLSESNLEQIKMLDKRINTIYADACEPVLDKKKFDLVVALEVLEHIIDPNLAIQNWKSLLQPNGRLLICVPYKETIRQTLCIHCNQKTPINAHLHSFDLKSLGCLLHSNGMRMCSYKLFSHKLLLYLMLDKALRLLPFCVWHRLDQLCGLAGDKYNYLAIICKIK